MPKNRSRRSVSVDRPSPFPNRSSKRQRYSPPATPTPAAASSSSSRNPPRSRAPATKVVKEWDDVRCPVCMEHPHNAVLLICASHNKGCRPFMCDTSYRHSNCLDQYRKSYDGAAVENEGESKDKLSCPLCRGIVSGWMVVVSARKYMNAKSRSCSTESCGFAGDYLELRRHARIAHPLVRPSAADPKREQDWMRMEQQRDIGDLFSTMHSVFVGDDEDLGFTAGDGEFGSYLQFYSSALLLVQRLQESGGLDGRSGRSSVWRGSSTPSRSHGRRVESHWGESIRDNDAFNRIPSGTVHDGDVDDNDNRSGADGHLGNEEVYVNSMRRHRRTHGESIRDTEGTVYGGYVDYDYEDDNDDWSSADGHHGGEEVYGISMQRWHRRTHGEMRMIEDDEDDTV